MAPSRLARRVGHQSNESRLRQRRPPLERWRVLWGARLQFVASPHQILFPIPRPCRQGRAMHQEGRLDAHFQPDGTREGVRTSVDSLLKLLDGKKTLDLFERARVEPNTPIEIIAALVEYAHEGKIKGISLSEVKAETIRRVHKVHPISAVEVELSLWAMEPLTNDAATCAELGISLVACSPVGPGFLTGDIKSFDDIPDGDFRKNLPRL